MITKVTLSDSAFLTRVLYIKEEELKQEVQEYILMVNKGEFSQECDVLHFWKGKLGIFLTLAPIALKYSILHKNLTGGVLYFEIEIRPVKNSNNARNCAPDVVS